MLIARQDIGVLIFYYCGYSRIRNFIQRIQFKPVTRFLAFHDIRPESLKQFKSNLNFLKRHTNIISFDDFMLGKLSVKKINTVITFDDGFKSWITYAVPILLELALPATFFISAGFIGLSENDESVFIRSNLLLEGSPHRITTGGLTCDDVKNIAEQGFTIGGHTLNHCNLSTIRDIGELKSEITEDKLALEKLIGTEINYFSYPIGAYQNPEINIAEILKIVGYIGAVTTASGNNDAKTNPYLLHRELTDASMPGQVFRARVYGNYDAVDALKQLRLRFARS